MRVRFNRGNRVSILQRLPGLMAGHYGSTDHGKGCEADIAALTRLMKTYLWARAGTALLRAAGQQTRRGRSGGGSPSLFFSFVCQHCPPRSISLRPTISLSSRPPPLPTAPPGPTWAARHNNTPPGAPHPPSAVARHPGSCATENAMKNDYFPEFGKYLHDYKNVSRGSQP